jgi:hypothetical protein
MAETFKNNNGVAVTNTEADLYAAPAGTTAVVISVRVSNVDGSADDTITADVIDGSNTSNSRIANTMSVPADTSLELAGTSKIVLETGDKIDLTGGAASGDLEAFVSILELT